MKKVIFALFASMCLFGCDDDSSSTDVLYCAASGVQIEHGAQPLVNPDEGRDHFCVVIDGKPSDEISCSKEGKDLIGLSFGAGGLFDTSLYDCVKDDDDHLYRATIRSARCEGDVLYSDTNNKGEVCAYINNEFVLKPVCKSDADHPENCKKDDGGKVSYGVSSGTGSDGGSGSEKLYCDVDGTKIEHGAAPIQGDDEERDHFCVVIDGKAYDKSSCEKEGNGQFGAHYGIAGFMDLYQYDCVKDDDGHLYEDNYNTPKCDGDLEYGKANDNAEICVLVDGNLTLKPVCMPDADHPENCIKDDIGKTSYGK